jgi:modulator of FtsH protease HflC
MSGTKLAVVGILVAILGIVGFGTMFTVHQAEQALVLQFGEPMRKIDAAGLHFKLPFVQDVLYFDKRVLDFDAQAEEVPTSDQKQLVVDAFARYRIVDPLRFFQSVNNIQGMEPRLNTIINSRLRAVFGDVTLATLMSSERARLITSIAALVKEEGKPFGIEVIDVRIKRVDVPEENSQAIFRRMQTQREQEARKIRAEGQKDSKRIHADADKQFTIIQANAQKQSEILRGEGEAGAQEIYNDAASRDRGFFDFWLSMNAMREGLTGKSTRYVGPPGGDFFKFFGDQTGGAGKK